MDSQMETASSQKDASQTEHKRRRPTKSVTVCLDIPGYSVVF